MHPFHWHFFGSYLSVVTPETTIDHWCSDTPAETVVTVQYSWLTENATWRTHGTAPGLPRTPEQDVPALLIDTLMMYSEFINLDRHPTADFRIPSESCSISTMFHRIRVQRRSRSWVGVCPRCLRSAVVKADWLEKPVRALISATDREVVLSNWQAWSRRVLSRNR